MNVVMRDWNMNKRIEILQQHYDTLKKVEKLLNDKIKDYDLKSNYYYVVNCVFHELREELKLLQASTDGLEIIEVDQWTSSGDMQNQDFDTVDIDKVSGGDSEAVKRIWGGHLKKYRVFESKRPSIGNVWYVKGYDGKCKLYMYNYDTSD